MTSDLARRFFDAMERSPDGVVPDQGGLHFDDGKPRVDLVPPRTIIEVAKVFGYGASKYGPRNWERGIAQSRLYGSTLRHLFAWCGGEDIDQESAHLHLAHAAANIMMMIDLSLDGRCDDRPSTQEREHGDD